MKKRYITLLFLIIIETVYSQQNPPSVKWMEINSEHVKVIFDKGLEKQAAKVANFIDYLYPLETKTLKGNPRKIPLIIYNNSTISNGFVGLRPWRSAWYITPSQYAADLTTEDWFYTLGSHEFRHAVQYDKSNKYFTKLLSILTGQSGILTGQYSYPYWYFEGDAVCMETGLSDKGRGRMPQFNMGIRTILLNNKKISYDKAKFRSYKTFYPGHYNLGWLLTSYAREHYGANIWDKTLETSAKYSFWPYAFSLALKYHTGLNEKQLYEKAMHDLDSAWTNKIKNLKIDSIEVINRAPKKSWTKYTEPVFTDDNNILVKKSSMKSDITSFYIIDKNGNEKKIKATDAGIISAACGKITWARRYPDIRWQLRDYSDIIIFDIKTEKEKRLTKKQKLFAPALSSDGKKIAAVEFTDEMKCALVIIDAETGKTINKFPANSNDFYRTPSWNDNNDKVVLTRSNENGTALSIINTETGEITDILPVSPENTGRPAFYKDYILYNSPYNGIGNIYAVNINTKERFQVTSRKYGAYNPKVKDDEMLFIDYSEEGYDIAKITLNEKKFMPIEKVKFYGLNTADIIQKQEQGKNMLKPELIPDKKFEPKKYNRFKNALNIHSWGLYLNEPDDYSNLSNYNPEAGVKIYSANILNTVFGSIGGTYNINEETLSSNITAIFKRFYPEFSISGNWAERRAVYTLYDQDADKYYLAEDRWNERKATLKTSVPFNFSKGIFYKGANISASYSFVNRNNKDYRYISESAEGNFSALSYSGQIYAFRHTATQDIYPKTGYFLYATYSNTPFNTDIYGHQFASVLSVYLPGIINHHSLNLKFGFETQRSDFDNTYYWFGSPLSFPRGYDYKAFDKLSVFQVNYAFPLWYPDFNIGPLTYLKRIRAGLFYDYADLNEIGIDASRKYASAGLEMFFEMYVFRLSEPIEIGGRVSYIINQFSSSDDRFVPEFIVLSIPI
ncbi:MAG: hypothetical protein GXO50_08000 [Chlorobi bacterium]|nr:hypothetical protein [Chlorobiota bacterium]